LICNYILKQRKSVVQKFIITEV